MLTLLGAAISYYAFSIEQRKSEDEEFGALCDIASWSSCSAAFSGKYGTGFGFVCDLVGEESVLCQKNSVYGIVSYLSMVPLILIGNLITAEILLFMSLGSIAISLFLAYVLWITKNLCLVCASCYVINILLLYYNWNSRMEIMATTYSDIEIEEIKKNN